MTYGDNNEIVLSGKGTGGLTELKTQLNSNQVYFGVARVRAVDDHGSKRAKFVFITFVGSGVVSIFFKYCLYEIFSIFLSHHCVVLVFRPISRKWKDFSMVIMFRCMPILKMTCLKKQSQQLYMLLLVHINQKHMNSLNYFFSSFSFANVDSVHVLLLDIDILFYIQQIHPF